MDWKESIVENLMKINEGFVLFSHNSKPENGFCGKAVTHQHSVYAKLLIEHHWTTICLLESIYNISGFLLRIGHIAILEAFTCAYLCIITQDPAKSQTASVRHYIHAAESRYTATRGAFPYGSHSSLDTRNSTKAQR